MCEGGFSDPCHNLFGQVVLYEVCFNVGLGWAMLFSCLLGFVVYGVISLFVSGGGALLLYVLFRGVSFDLGDGDGVWLAVVCVPELFPDVCMWSVWCDAPCHASMESCDNVLAIGFDVYVTSHVYGSLEEGM